MKTLQKGFTLIELLITIAIIGALAAIAVPTYLDYLQSSELEAVERNCQTASRFLKQEYAKMFTDPSTSQSSALSYSLNDGGLATSPLNTSDAFVVGGTSAALAADGQIVVAIDGATNAVTDPNGDADIAFDQTLAGGYTATITCDLDGDYTATAGDSSAVLRLSL